MIEQKKAYSSTKNQSQEILRLVEIVQKLRGLGGCPWDKEQTHSSMRASLIEECYEVVEAINGGEDAHLCEELGDLLLQVVFHAQIARERGVFALGDVAAAISQKLVRRHPHVFGEANAADSQEVLRQWEQIKRAEKGDGASVMDGLATALPALMRAENVQKKAARIGFDWNDAEGVFKKLDEEIAELHEALAEGRSSTDSSLSSSLAANKKTRQHIEEELGDVLFVVVNLARHLKVDAETALAAATAKFVRRFQAVEKHLAAQGRRIEDTTLDEKEAAWEHIKKKE